MIYVDAIHGNDRNNGSMDRPLQSILQAVKQSTPGEVLQLEAGEHELLADLSFPHALTLRGRGNEFSGKSATFLHMPSDEPEGFDGVVCEDLAIRKPLTFEPIACPSEPGTFHPYLPGTASVNRMPDGRLACFDRFGRFLGAC